MKQIQKKVWKSRAGAPFKAKDAQLIGEYLESHELNTNEKMLDDARKEDSILHPFFDWDDSSAAEKYRIVQANNIRNHLSVEIVYVNGEVQEFDKGFGFVTINQVPQFIPTEQGLNEKETREQLLKSAWSDVEGSVRRNQQFHEFIGIVDATEKTRVKLKKTYRWA